MQQGNFFIPESPKENIDMQEEELFTRIFPSKIENTENFDEINMQKLYFLNIQNKQKPKKKDDSQKNEEALNEILLIDDYEAVFNKLESNENEQGNEDSFFHNENYEKEDYNMPSFVKNVVRENKCFYPMKIENDELIINVEEINKKNKNKDTYKNENLKPSIKKKKNHKNDSKSKKKPENPKRVRTKRGPYKKKSKIVQQINTDDICFPFSSGKNVFNGINPVLQTCQTFYSIDNCNISMENENSSEYNEQSFIEDNKIKKSTFDENRKEEETFKTGQINSSNDINWWKFTTKKYFIASNGKKKRIKKKRKYKPDDIRKKIKARFHKTIKNIINENLKKAGSQVLFDFISQSFIGNVSKKVNSKSLELTYEEMLSTDFNEEISTGNKVESAKYLKNLKVLKYLEENPEIARRSGFDLVKNKKYKDLLKLYFASAQFENSINQLKAENESNDYILEYTYRAKTYIRFYSSYENNEGRKNDNFNLIKKTDDNVNDIFFK